MQIAACARVCRIGWHTLTATAETGLKCRNYLLGLCIRASLRWNTSQLSRDTIRLYSDATRNGSPSASSKKGILVSIECRVSDGWKMLSDYSILCKR